MCVHISMCVCVEEIVTVMHLLLTVEIRNITNFPHKSNNIIWQTSYLHVLLY